VTTHFGRTARVALAHAQTTAAAALLGGNRSYRPATVPYDRACGQGASVTASASDQRIRVDGGQAQPLGPARRTWLLGTPIPRLY
jgi:hypothetical protein